MLRSRRIGFARSVTRMPRRRGRPRRKVGMRRPCWRSGNRCPPSCPGSRPELERIKAEVSDVQLGIPNVLHSKRSGGREEADNVEVRRWGTPREFEFDPKDHVVVGARLGMDFEAASRISGARFVVMTGHLAKLHRALIQFMLDMHTREHGYREAYVPYLVHAAALSRHGPAAEVRAGSVRGEGGSGIFLDSDRRSPGDQSGARSNPRGGDAAPQVRGAHALFPIGGGRGREGHSRHDPAAPIRESGAGADRSSGGFLRRARGAHRPCGGDSQGVGIALPCGGALRRRCGFSSAKTYDLEVWLPSQKRYREISSCSNFESFQARRLQARWRNPATGKPEPVHTLNGSGVAVGRALVAILENYQQADGSVVVPPALGPYMAETMVLGERAGA